VEHHCLGDWCDNRAVDLRGVDREILTTTETVRAAVEKALGLDGA
jgi:hypothetical protein